MGLKVGDKVTADININCGTCYYCRHGEPLLCDHFSQLGIHMDGTFAEYVKAPWKQVHKLPDNFKFQIRHLWNQFHAPSMLPRHSMQNLAAAWWSLAVVWVYCMPVWVSYVPVLR